VTLAGGVATVSRAPAALEDMVMRVERIEPLSPDFAEVRRIRREVFVGEQGVSPENEFDHVDADAIHFLAWQGDAAVGTARLYGEDGLGRIGRVAVLRAYRHGGFGEALMRAALAEAARLGYPEVLVHAQTRVRAFYERLGFQCEGTEYMEENIPHLNMRHGGSE